MLLLECFLQLTKVKLKSAIVNYIPFIAYMTPIFSKCEAPLYFIVKKAITNIDIFFMNN